MKLQIIPHHLQDALGHQRPLADMSRSELSLCLDVLARIIHSNPEVEILRPEEHQFSLSEIQAFRHQQYERISPYLLTPEQEEIEAQLQLDERSYHFVAVRDEEIVGTVRVTQRPFEFSTLTPELSEMSDKFGPEYWEMGRLVIDSSVNGAFSGEKLLFGAARWLCMKTDVHGFLLICKQKRKRYFEYYGLEPIADKLFEIPQRNLGRYYLMMGTFPRLIDSIFSTLYWNPDEMNKRLRWTQPK
jgi:predicted GNAT family N-acyltransferase